MALLLIKVSDRNQLGHERGKNMNGYYRRRSGLPFEEIRPLEINEIEFVSDVGELCVEDSFCECLICGKEVSGDDENYCEECCGNLIEN
jgi:hypothetical protein